MKVTVNRVTVTAAAARARCRDARLVTERSRRRRVTVAGPGVGGFPGRVTEAGGLVSASVLGIRAEALAACTVRVT